MIMAQLIGQLRLMLEIKIFFRSFYIIFRHKKERTKLWVILLSKTARVETLLSFALNVHRLMNE